MNSYAFELGRKKELSFAELISMLGQKKLIERGLDTAIFKLDQFDHKLLQDRLGGTIKIIRIFEHIIKANLKPTIQSHLEESFKNHSGKIPFSISILNFKNPRDINIKELLNFSKKILKSLGLNSRFVNKDFRNTKPSTIYKARVIQKGIDLCIIKSDDGIYLGESVTIQDIDAYSLRDFHKPGRDARVGMLPPKLAQIMINLAGAAKTIYDPFCGTGTIPMEALLMERIAVGSDIDERMIEFSEKNCEWLSEKFQTSKNYRFFKKDAQTLTEKDIPEKIDAIITEGYLGKPISRVPSPESRKITFRELSELHLNWLTKIHKLTPQKCPIVMCVTAFRDGNRIEHLPNFPELANKAGYRITQIFTYDRPDQLIARDIKVLEKI